MTDIQVNKPTPFLAEGDIAIFNRGTDIQLCIKTLEAGKPILITGFYNNGAILLKEIHHYLNKKLPNKTFKEQREYRSAYHKLSNLVLIELYIRYLS